MNLRTFFAEKKIEEQSWELLDSNGVSNFIDTEVVIESIFSAPKHEQEQIKTVLRKLDFQNQPIEPFLKHLAQAMVNMRASS